MKKFKLFLLAAVAVLPVLQSCNDSDVEGADSMALVTILNPGGLSGTFYFKADNGQTLYPSQFAVPTGGYNPEDGQRAFIYYSLLEEKSQQYDYNIKLYGISEILTKDVEEMNESNEAEFGDEPIELVKLSGEDKFDCLISAGYFTCSFQIKVTGREKQDQLGSKRFGGRYRRPRLHAARTAPQTRRHGIGHFRSEIQYGFVQTQLLRSGRHPEERSQNPL